MGKVEIYNRALNLLGLDPISSVLEENKRTRTLNLAYDMVLDELLIEEPWGFSKKRAKLAQLSDSTVSQCKYEYQYPADCLKIVEIFSETDILNSYSNSKKWEIIGDRICSDTKDLYADYIHIPSDISKWFSYFKTCLAYKLAIECCYALINSNSREEYLSNKYETTILPRAISIDAQQERPVEEGNALLAAGDDVRGGYVSGSRY